MMKLLIFFLITTNIMVADGNKKRDHVKIPKARYFKKDRLKQFIDTIILHNRTVFGEKKYYQINMASLMDDIKEIRESITKSNFNFYEKIYKDAGVYVCTKEEYEEKYVHLKTFEEKASERLKEMQFPENPNLSQLSDEKEIENCNRCIEILKRYSDTAQFILSEKNITKGRCMDNKTFSQKNSMSKEIYENVNFLQSAYNENNCLELLERVNFDKQIEKTSGISFKKFYKAFKLLADRYNGLCNPFSWFEK